MPVLLRVYRSFCSYFFLLPLFAFAALARMPVGELDPAHARAAGAITRFALPSRLRGGPMELPQGAPAAD